MLLALGNETDHLLLLALGKETDVSPSPYTNNEDWGLD